MLVLFAREARSGTGAQAKGRRQGEGRHAAQAAATQATSLARGTGRLSTMAPDKYKDKIGALLQRGAWEDARKLLERERERNPEDHWLLTQLGVTFYEQQHHDQALPLFQASLQIVPDCPLTLWNLAGTLDAIGK